jgi:hypothetical protein
VSVWRNRGFTENELGPPAKLAVGVGALARLLLLAGGVAANAAEGIVPRPWTSLIVALGFLFFLVPPLQVVRTDNESALVRPG